MSVNSSTSAYKQASKKLIKRERAAALGKRAYIAFVWITPHPFVLAYATFSYADDTIVSDFVCDKIDSIYVTRDGQWSDQRPRAQLLEASPGLFDHAQLWTA